MKKLLVVDDDKDLCNLIHEYFEEKGYQVLVAHNGKIGLEVAEREEVDLIILDVQMPVMNGFAFLKAIRSMSHLSYLPILMLTTVSGEEFQVAGLKTGADDYLTKPFSLDVLEARIESLLRRTQKVVEAKRDQYNLLRYLITHYEKRDYSVYTKLLDGYQDHPDNWKGFVPDLIVFKGGKYKIYFFESFLTLNDETTISKWKSVVDKYPYAEIVIVVRNKESFELARRLMKIYNLPLTVKHMRRKKGSEKK